MKVLPGQKVTNHVNNILCPNGYKIMNGLILKNDEIVVIKAGILQKVDFTPIPLIFVECMNSKIYSDPLINDNIIGIIEDRGAGDYYKVNINCGKIGLLNKISFQGATKRNRPDLKKGDIIYCRVIQAHLDLDPELTCIASNGITRDWSSGETIYGELSGGCTLQVNNYIVKYLLAPKCKLLKYLAQYINFEIVIGMNNIIWYKCKNPIDSIIIRNSIINCESLTSSEQEIMVQSLISKGRGKK